MTARFITPSSFELFTDGSFDPQSGLGVGAYLLLDGTNGHAQSSTVVTKAIATTSCARLELKTLLWALDEFQTFYLAECLTQRTDLIIYTDSKTIVELDSRRARLEEKNFASGRTGLPLSNGDLYQDYFRLRDHLSSRCQIRFFWVKGHSKKDTQTREQALFSRVDYQARKALRELR